MADQPGISPFSAFNFSVAITPEGDPAPLCDASFSECDGLEMSMEVKTIREGGNNGVQVKLAGAAAYGQLTLKRGMTSGFDLWSWFERVNQQPSLRAGGEVVVYAADGVTKRATFVLRRCLPVKIKAPALNAREGIVAIEEMQLAYESLSLQPSEGDGGG